MIYFIREAWRGWIKIGYTDRESINPRFRAVWQGLPQDAKVLVTTPGSRRQEYYLHVKFRDRRRKGEWFEPNPEMLELVRYLKTGGGLVVEEGHMPDWGRAHVPLRKPPRLGRKETIRMPGMLKRT